MSDKQNSVSRLMEMQRKLKNLNKQAEDTIKEEKNSIPMIEDKVEEDTSDTLPSKYLSINQVKLSAKEVANTTSYAEKLKQTDERYESISITEEKANKIRKELVRLTTGVSSVVPLQCKGSQCSFASTCITGDSVVSGYQNKQIKDIEIGDKVYSFDINTKTIETDVVKDKKSLGIKPIWKLTTRNNQTLKLTEDHKVLVCNSLDETLYWDSIEESLSTGDIILTDDIDIVYEDINSIGDSFTDYIVDIEYVGEEEVFDITVSKNQNFFANNILVHNCPYMKEDIAPVGLPCQPYYSKVLTADHGYVDIQDLDSDIHKVMHIVSRDGAKQNGSTGKVRTEGSTFRKVSRTFNGNLVRVTTESGKSYDSTPEHISYIKWKRDAVEGKIAVYLMYKEGKFRIGRTKLVQGGKSEGTHVYGGFAHRCKKEDAEKGWILGVYDNLIEAHMGEEYWSIITQTPKMLFIATQERDWNGVTRWMTQEQLDNHFKNFDMSFEKYEKILANLGLSIYHPLYTKGGDPIDNGLSFTRMVRIRSCNIIPELMEVYVLKTIKDGKARAVRSTKDQWDFETITSVEHIPYDGLIYSLEVHENPNYITDDGIATHNCPVEQQLLEYWMEKYKEEYGIEDHQITDLHMVGRLCTYDIYEMRLTRYLSEHDQTLLVDFISSYDEENNPISNKATSAAWDTIDKIDRMRSKLLKELMATREAKSKLIKTVNEANQTNSFTALKSRFEELIKKTEAKVVN